MIRRATIEDIPQIAVIYDKILQKEEAKETSIGWVRGVYPTERTARDAVERNEMFVLENEGMIYAAAKINQEQVEEYAKADWEYQVSDDEIMVLHTLVVSPDAAGKGYGTEFVKFYETYALEHNCAYLRMDTNKINAAARSLYKKLGYSERGIVDCDFNGIAGIKLVCLEKKLSNVKEKQQVRESSR